MCWVLVNIFAVRAIHYINSFALALHVFGFFIVIGVLAAFTKEKHNADFVFTALTNNSGWNSDFVAWSISLLPALYAYMSVDTAIHFCEEVAEPRTVIPRVMILQAITTSLMTFPFIITVVFCLGNVDQILASPIALTSPFTQILINSTGKVGLSCFLNSFSTFVAMTAGFDMWGAASRAIWSMARDNALPPRFAKLHPRWAVSVWANLAMIPPSILVFSIYIWNTTAFYGIMSGVLVAFQLSYLIPIGINVFYATWSTPLTKGPFQLGRLSWAVHATGFVFGCFAALFMSFPASQPVTTISM
ncbi:hypothetical protein CDD81_7581 [Ophiocordyceps australis]|uniref:Amino acid transporter transmembrane domain-containing protein n=1 Tax=Ophiocordyceps australis TaxID=1399860 RepID=A0A2C5XGT0_9HYPO|nr:hypothetical protein CDD81_7581 [Ophiocordyceps australis]